MNKRKIDTNKKNKPIYTSDINVIASIPDFNLINDVISAFANGKGEDYINEEIFKQNIYGIRTLKSRERFLSAIKKVFIKFKTEEHQKVFYALFTQNNFVNLKRVALYFQFAFNDQLFYELNTKVYMKFYKAGRLTVPKDEFIAYLYDLRDNKLDIQNWSNSTLDIIASKYLTLLKKLGFLKGRSRKEFCTIDLDDPIIIYIVYLLKSLGNINPDIMKNPYLDILPYSQDNLYKRIKKISLSDYFKIYTLGYDLKVNLKYGFEEIVNVIIQNYRSKV
jgi:hypothetical protein